MSDRFKPTAIARAERAGADLRRGLPVILNEAGGDFLVLAAEKADADTLSLLRERPGRVHLALTPERADTLKIRRYSEGAILVPVTPSMGLEDVIAAVDPADDLDHPLKGPYLAEREPAAARDAAVSGFALAKRARLLPALLLQPIATDDPLRADLLTVSAADIAGAAREDWEGLERVVAARLPIDAAENARIVAFRPRGSAAQEHFAIVVGEIDASKPVLVRLHSECFTGDLLGSLKCDCGPQLRGALARIGREGAGIVLYLAQEGRGIGLLNKLRAYHLQDQGFDTVEANVRLGFGIDERHFALAARMLRDLGVSRVRLLTNNPDKVAGLEAEDIAVEGRVPLVFTPNPHNEDYLRTKALKTGHLF